MDITRRGQVKLTEYTLQKGGAMIGQTRVFVRTPVSPSCTAGANMILHTTTRNARNTTYMIRVVMDDLAPDVLQQIPQADGPQQQHSSSSRHMLGSPRPRN